MEEEQKKVTGTEITQGWRADIMGAIDRRSRSLGRLPERRNPGLWTCKVMSGTAKYSHYFYSVFCNIDFIVITVNPE